MDYVVEAKSRRKAAAGFGSGGLIAGTASVVGAIMLGPEWGAIVGIGGGMFLGLLPMLAGLEGMLQSRSFAYAARVGNAAESSGSDALMAAVEKQYGIKLSEDSAFSLLQGVVVTPAGRWKLGKETLSGGLHRFGTAIQVSGNEPFHVQLAWDGQKFLLLDIADDPESVTEFRKRESVSF